MSRTPVREALTRLAQEGYVSLLQNRGFICKEIGMQEAEEIYDLREALEAFAVEAATAKTSEAKLDRLSAMMNLYGQDVQKRFSRDRLIYDQDLHLEIARASGNETLVKHLAQVFERIILKRRTDGLYDPARGLAAHQEHLEIFSAMKRREVGEAVMLVRRHIRKGKENVLADLRRREEVRGGQSNGSSLIG